MSSSGRSLAELTIQLARESGVDPASLAESLRRHPSTAAVADKIHALARSSSNAPAARPNPSSAPPAHRPPVAFNPLSFGWWTEPVFWLPIPGGQARREFGIAPWMLLAAFFAYQHYQGGQSGE